MPVVNAKVNLQIPLPDPPKQDKSMEKALIKQFSILQGLIREMVASRKKDEGRTIRLVDRMMKRQDSQLSRLGKVSNQERSALLESLNSQYDRFIKALRNQKPPKVVVNRSAPRPSAPAVPRSVSIRLGKMESKLGEALLHRPSSNFSDTYPIVMGGR